MRAWISLSRAVDFVVRRVVTWRVCKRKRHALTDTQLPSHDLLAADQPALDARCSLSGTDVVYGFTRVHIPELCCGGVRRLKQLA